KRGAKIKASGASRQCSVHFAKIFEAARTLFLWLSGWINLQTGKSLTCRLASANLFTLHFTCIVTLLFCFLLDQKATKNQGFGCFPTMQRSFR
ncbi:MAG: hypothetical protein ACNA7Z_07675, partial [Dethiobacteria bacterium]